MRAAQIPPSTLGIDVLSGAGEEWITLSGELDIATVPPLREALGLCLLAPSPRIVIDAAGLSFIAVIGVRLVAIAHKDALDRGGSLVVRGLTPAVRRVFELCDGLVLPLHGLLDHHSALAPDRARPPQTTPTVVAAA